LNSSGSHTYDGSLLSCASFPKELRLPKCWIFENSIGTTQLCCNIVTIYYVNNTSYINYQPLKVKILATCFSYSEQSSG
jgi:hypothetical protein